MILPLYWLIFALIGVAVLFVRFGEMVWYNLLFTSMLIGLSAGTAAWMIVERPW